MKQFLLLMVLLIAAMADASFKVLNKTETLYQSKFRSFVETFQRDYDTPDEEEKRYRIWKGNLNYIENHNREASAGLHEFFLKMNCYGDMTLVEFSRQSKGYNSNLRQIYQNDDESEPVFKLHQTNGDAKLPDSIDYRTLGFITKVKEQKTCGACYAFAATTVMEAANFKATGNLIELSEQQLLDCTRNNGNEGCSGGWPRLALQYALSEGIQSDSSYPYMAKDQICSARTSNETIKIKELVIIPEADEYALQDAIARIGPVTAAIDSTRRSFQFYSHGVYYEPKCSRFLLDHAVAVVGFGTQNGSDYYIVKNSWGKTWGSSGYILMARNRGNNCGIGTDAAYALA